MQPWGTPLKGTIHEQEQVILGTFKERFTMGFFMKNFEMIFWLYIIKCFVEFILL